MQTTQLPTTTRRQTTRPALVGLPKAQPRRPLLLPRFALEEEVRRLNYYRGLLAAGYRSALTPGLTAETLRSERIALRIPFPELDAVPLWSARRSDGMISIPFIEFILGQMIASVDRLCRAMGTRKALGDLVESRPALRRALSEASRGGPEVVPLPRLSDIFLPPAFVDRLCREGGLLDRVVTRSEEMVDVGDRGSLTVV